jgi:hypothetical protein
VWEAACITSDSAHEKVGSHRANASDRLAAGQNTFVFCFVQKQIPIKEMGIFWSALIVPNASQSFSRWAEYYLPLSFV